MPFDPTDQQEQHRRIDAVQLSARSKMGIEYCVMRRDEGWMIERQGHFYGPYSSQQEAVREAVYVANYSINHGLPAEVVVQKYS